MDCLFPRKVWEKSSLPSGEGFGFIENLESRGLFRAGRFPEGIPAIRNHHARALLKMVWFLDTREASLAWNPVTWGLGRCGLADWLRWANRPCMHRGRKYCLLVCVLYTVLGRVEGNSRSADVRRTPTPASVCQARQ